VFSAKMTFGLGLALLFVFFAPMSVCVRASSLSRFVYFVIDCHYHCNRLPKETRVFDVTLCFKRSVIKPSRSDMTCVLKRLRSQSVSSPADRKLTNKKVEQKKS